MLSLIAATVAATAVATTATGPATVKAGVERWRAGDYAAAVATWLPFAAQGDADAAFNMGQAYKLGRGVTKDPAVARDYYRRAAAKGHLPAQANLGIALFQAGDKLEAVKWLKQAADRGEPRAQYVLGIAAYNGDGTPKNLGLAYGYLLRAQASGLAQATTALGSIEPVLSPEARSAGTAMAASLAAGTGVPPALAAASVVRTGPAGIQRPGVAPAPAPSLAANVVSNVRDALGLSQPKPPAAKPQVADSRPAPTRPPADIAPAATRPPAPAPLATASAPPPLPRPVTTPPQQQADAPPRPAPVATATAGPPDPKPLPATPGVSPPATIATVSIPAATPPAKPAVAEAKPPAPKPVKVAEAAPPKPKPAGWRVQLGAFSSQKQADAAWSSIKTSQSSAIGKAKPIFDTSGPVVKFQLGPYASKDAARDTCAKLAFAGKACFVTQG